MTLLLLLVVDSTCAGTLWAASPFIVICGVFAGYKDELDTWRILDFCSSAGPLDILWCNPAAKLEISSTPPSYIDRTLWESASSSADRTLVGRLVGGDNRSLLKVLRLPITRPLLTLRPCILFAFLPPISMLPLFENSTCPGNVKSSKLPDGISVSMLMNGNSGIAESSVCSFASSAVVFGLGESFAEKLGMLGERFMLVVDSTSVPNVVRLSLVVELEGARPESLLASSCSFDRAV